MPAKSTSMLPDLILKIFWRVPKCVVVFSSPGREY